MRFPIPEGQAHNLIRDRARYYRQEVDVRPRSAFLLALLDWRDGGLAKVKPKQGAIYKVNFSDYRQ